MRSISNVGSVAIACACGCALHSSAERSIDTTQPAAFAAVSNASRLPALERGLHRLARVGAREQLHDRRAVVREVRVQAHDAPVTRAVHARDRIPQRSRAPGRRRAGSARCGTRSRPRACRPRRAARDRVRSRHSSDAASPAAAIDACAAVPIRNDDGSAGSTPESVHPLERLGLAARRATRARAAPRARRVIARGTPSPPRGTSRAGRGAPSDRPSRCSRPARS